MGEPTPRSLLPSPSTLTLPEHFKRLLHRPPMSDSEFATPRPRAVEPRPLSPRVTSLTPESIVRLLSDLRLGTHDPYVHDVVVSESLSVDQPASADLADVQSPSDVTASSLHVVSHSSSETKAAPSSGISASVFDTFNNATIPGSTIDAGTESQAGESVVWSEDLASSTIERSEHGHLTTLRPSAG